MDYGDHRAPQSGLEGRIVEEFLAAYTGHTQAACRRDLRDYLTYCQTHGIRPLAATRVDIAGYLQSLRDANLTEATIARRRVTLRGLYRLAVTEYQTAASSPAERIRIRRPRYISRIPALTRTQLNAFLAAADIACRRTSAMAWLFATTGLRISEACTAQRHDITGRACEQPWPTVTCKGGPRRSVPLHPQTWRRTRLLPEVHAPVFATHTRRPLDRHAAARALTAVATNAGISGPFSPHILRHTFVTLARQAGCPLETVQEAAGHADPATTRGYDRTQQTHADHPAHHILRLLEPSDAPRQTHRRDAS